MLILCCADAFNIAGVRCGGSALGRKADTTIVSRKCLVLTQSSHLTPSLEPQRIRQRPASLFQGAYALRPIVWVAVGARSQCSS